MNKDPSGARSSASPSRSVWKVSARILELAYPYRWTFGLSLLLSLLATGVSLTLPMGVRALLDQALGAKNAQLLHLLTLSLLALFVVRFALSYLGTYLLLVAGERVGIDLRTKLFGHLQLLDLPFYQAHRVGDLVSRITTDCASIRTAVNENLAATAMALIQVLASIVIMMFLNWRLGVVVLALAPVTTLLSSRFGPKLQQLSRQAVDSVARAIGFAQEVLAGILVVKAFDRTDHETDRFRNLLTSVFAITKRSAKVNSLFRSLINLVGSAANIAIFWYGGLEVMAGRLTIGDLVAFLFYSQTVSQGIGQVAQQFGDLSRMVGSSERVFEILDLPSAMANQPGARSPSKVEGRIEFRNVSFAYQAHLPLVLDGASFAVNRGETVGIVGLSGGGKSTLLQLLCRLYDPTRGQVLLDDQDYRELDLSWLRQQVALVSQDTYLFSGTVRENIRYGRLEAADEEIIKAARDANAEEFILRLPQTYDTEVGERGVKLSGGQKQRIALARALVKAAPILVLDEATSAVDSISEKLIQDALEKNRGLRTTLIVAHRLATIRSADRIFVLEGGRFVESGLHDELMQQENAYYQLVQGQSS